MTYLCVSIFVESAEQAKRDIALAAEAGADMVELRIDEFPGDACDLVDHALLPTIVTKRPTWEGGRSKEPDAARIETLSLLSHRAGYVDYELETLRRVPTPREDLGSRLIISSHDFAGRPDRLYNILSELDASPADINKIVWTARTIRDNIEAFEILLARQKPTIALCMGEAGMISRILAKKFGAFLTFASLTKDSATAPGQVTIADLKNLYRWDAITPATAVYGVVGSPVGHSMSPAIHNAAFAKVDHDGVYVPLLVNEGYESFKAFMESFLAFAPLNLRGLSVTIPHKENALRYLREKGGEIEPLAERIGAVNTIVIEGSGFRVQGSGGAGTSNIKQPTTPYQLPTTNYQLSGLNTDYAAILDSVTAALGITRDQLRDLRVAVIGAGGTGRTASAAFAHYGAAVTIFNRTKDRADSLAAEFNGHTGSVTAAPLEALRDSDFPIYINTTSIGMHPKTDASPFDAAPPRLSPATLVFDCIYNPIRTKLLQHAESAGAKTISGLEMFVRQAAAQFEAWTGTPAPRDLMRDVIVKKLG